MYMYLMRVSLSIQGKIRPIFGVALHATIRGSGPVTVNGDNPGDRGEEERGLNNWSHFGGAANGVED